VPSSWAKRHLPRTTYGATSVEQHVRSAANSSASIPRGASLCTTWRTAHITAEVRRFGFRC